MSVIHYHLEDEKRTLCGVRRRYVQSKKVQRAWSDLPLFQDSCVHCIKSFGEMERRRALRRKNWDDE